MTKSNSTAREPARKDRRPRKPHPNFSLTPHPSGWWCKKITPRQDGRSIGAGKLHYFGSWRNDPRGTLALKRWLEEKDDLLAGRIPRAGAAANAPTLGDLITQFLLTKSLLRDGGELSEHTWHSYAAVCDELLAIFGAARLLTDLLPEDFQKLRSKWAERWGPVRLGSEINRTRVVFHYAFKNGLIEKPILYGEGFNRPSQKTLRLHKAAKGPKLFEAEELRRTIDNATYPLKAMLLLGINAAFGNADVARLQFSAVDLEKGWINYPRPKTGISRRCPLWLETVDAIREWLKQRPAPKDPDDFALVFLTVRGNPWEKGTSNRAITHECRKLLDKLGIHGNRNFYALRHNFETIAGDTKDQVAVDAIMGHVDDSMAANYRQGLSDQRLQDVTAFVRTWLLTKKPEEKDQEPPRLRIASVSA